MVTLLDGNGNPKRPEDSGKKSPPTLDTPTTLTKEPEVVPTKEPPKPEPPARNAAYEGVIRDQQEVIRNQKETLAKMDERLGALEAGPPKDSKVANAEFWDKPVETVTELIRREMRETVQPLTEQITHNTNKSKLDDIKIKLSNENPAYKDVLDKAGEFVDALVQKGIDEGREPTIADVRAAIIGVRGAAAMNMLDGVSFDGTVPKPTNAPTPINPGSDNVITPPHIRPTAPRVEDPGNKKEYTMNDLSENERRLVNETPGMTANDYIHMRDNVTPLDVTTTVLPSEKKE